ncbi:hypothetical protein SAMN05518861_14721 [Mesorhizobium sp. YR577]|nr:hypothetical protein SAMN05518861_14721 [Mesorhizobium sp. YR577]
MLEHSADRLPARAQFIGDPGCQLLSIVPPKTPKTEVLQNLGAMSAGGPAGEIVMVHSFSIEAELLGQIQNTIRGNCRTILYEEAVRGEEFKLDRKPHLRQFRHAAHKRNIRKV